MREILLVFLLKILLGCQAANILVLHPIYCGSHELVLRSFGDLLFKEGHNVTQVHNLI